MENITKMQNIILENRNRLNVTGVVDVLNFDEQIITAVTNLGILTIKGSDLHLNQFCLDTAELSIEGDINSLQYSDKHGGKKGETFISRIFK